jgi:hypothetical protein
MGEWFPTSGELTIDQVHQQTRKKVLWNPQQSTDYLGNHNFQQDQEGIVIRTSSGQPLCNYCLIPSHAREKCELRLEHLSKGVDLLYHPQRGMLKSRNSQRKLAISEEMEYEKKLIAEEAEGNPRKKIDQSTEDLEIEGKNRDQTDQEFDIPHGKPNQEPNKDTKTKGRAHPRNTLASSTDTEGYKNFWQTRLGHLICSETGQVLGAYCGIQSHGRKDCYFKKDDEAIKITRVHHPDRGNLLSRNQQLLRMQPQGGASYKKHKSLHREGTWIRQFVPHASNNQGMANDINQNMDGWQRCNPYQEESQQPILRRKGQTERN